MLKYAEFTESFTEKFDKSIRLGNFRNCRTIRVYDVPSQDSNLNFNLVFCQIDFTNYKFHPNLNCFLDISLFVNCFKLKNLRFYTEMNSPT